MYRSASSNRVDDRYSYSSSPSASSKVSTALRALSLEANELPVYESFSEAIKKERYRAKFADNAVHLIPLVLLICALILWFFSNPDFDMQGKSSPAAAKIQGLTIEGDVDGDVTQTANLTSLELGDIGPLKQDDHHTKVSVLGNT